MTDINSCTFTGRLTKDCETRSTQGGMTVTRFSFANNWYSTSTKKEEASFFDAVMFGKMADSLSPYLKKGVAITLSGELRQQRFTTRDGRNASRDEIIVGSIKLQDRKDEVPKTEERTTYQMDGRTFSSREEYEAYKDQVFGGPDDAPKGPESFDDSDIPF